MIRAVRRQRSDIPAPMQNALYALLDELQSAARFRWQAILATWAFCALGWTGVMLLPNVYEATARVFADTRTALSPIIQGLAIEQDVAAQLNLVQQTLLGEERLERVIDETGLVANARTQAERAQLIEDLRDDIDISVQPSDKRENPGSIFWLRHQGSDRNLSLKVVETLLSSFVADTESGKLAYSEAAQGFLSKQIAQTEQRLREAEQRLAEFKRRNVGTMPGAEGDYFTRLQAEIDAARTARTALSVAISRKEELSKQLKDGALLAASSGVAPPSQSNNNTSARDTLSQLADAQARLDALLRQFTDRHPDVGVLRETIAQLKLQHEQELEALRRGDSATALPAGVTANPVYQSVRLALNQANVEVAALGRELSARETKVAELRRLVNSMPEVEAEYARLNRDYDVHKGQYVALVDRLEKARLGQDADATEAGVRLQVIDPPTSPTAPVSPNRPKLIVAVFGAGLMLGCAIAYLLSKLNPVFNHARDLEGATGLPVLGEVSLTWLDGYKRATRMAIMRFTAAAGALVLTFATVLLLQIKGIWSAD